MTKEQKQIAVIVGLLPILALAVISGLGRKKTAVEPLTQAVAPLQPDNPVLKENPQLPVEKSVKESQRKRAQGPWGRDPFTSDVYKSVRSESELKLQGISYREDKVGFAFINNEIVKKGDTVGGYEVAEILKDRVLLKKGSQSFYLAFPEE